MAQIRFPTAPVVSPNRARYVGVVDSAGTGDLAVSDVIEALPPGPLKTTLQSIPVGGAEGWNNAIVDLRLGFSIIQGVGLGNPCPVPVSMDTFTPSDVKVFRFYAPTGAVESLFVFEVYFNHSMLR